VSAVADHVGYFDNVIATEENNLKGAEKLAALKEQYPNAEISYIGDSTSDIPVWKGLGKALMVNPSRITKKRVELAQIPIEMIDNSRKLTLKLIRRSFRYHQWAKNLLIFLPLFLSHAYQADLWKISVLAFVAFSFTASSIYILNDLFDLEADRKHPKKRQRPFASGALSITQGLILYGITTSIALIMALLINPGFLICLLIYFLANLAYTLRLKQVHSLDIIMLAGMYTIRIIAGSETTGVEVSQWLLGFSTFLFFGLAALKRFVEVSSLAAGERAAGRGYFAEDKVPLAALGGASSLMACLVLALYFNSPAVYQLYAKPDILWLILPIHMYWVSSIWILASRGQIDDDPVLYTIKSRTTYVLAAIVGLIVYLAM
ncbi:MAG: UbiA family prenyltransferase, partial [Proteobacteria bacterium]